MSLGQLSPPIQVCLFLKENNDVFGGSYDDKLIFSICVESLSLMIGYDSAVTELTDLIVVNRVKRL